MADTPLWTFQDAVEHLLDIHEIPRANARSYRLAVRAVDTAYRDLPFRKRWSYYDRSRLLTTVAPISTGTLEYDHTGGSSERLVTISSAVVPEDVYLYRLMIGEVHYEISNYLSSTTLQLSVNSNPGADVAAGTGYTLYRNVYPLPVDFRKLNRIVDVEDNHNLAVVPNDRIHELVNWYGTTGLPFEVGIIGSGENYGAMSLAFAPPPDAARTYDIAYEAAPRQFSIEKYATGTVSITNGQLAVTGVSTVFPEDCVGSVIRFSADGTTEPTSKFGNVGDALNRYTAQRIITARTSDTAITVDATVGSTLSAVKYVISDPVDLEQGAMFTAFLRMAEAEYARLANMRDAEGRPTATSYEAAAQRALRLAMEADQRATNTRSSAPFNRFTRANVSTDG